MGKSAKSVLLTIISIVIISIFLSIDFYHDWFVKRVVKPIDDINEQLTYMEPEERMELRLGMSYIISKGVADYLRKNHADTSAIVLLPPQAYIKHYKANYPVPEPIVFYYYTGLKSKWISSPGVEKSNFAIIYQKNNIQLAPLNKQQLAEVLKVFRQY